LDLSCAKKIKVGVPRSGNCESGKENHAGLCYNPCKNGYKGVGKVCWSDNPTNWVECNLGAAKNSEACGKTIFNEVAKIGALALNIARLAASSAKLSAASAAVQLVSLRARFKALKARYNNSK